jgi:parallel beta-helix repeat protein
MFAWKWLLVLLCAVPICFNFALAQEDLADRLEKGGLIELRGGVFEISRPLTFTAPHRFTLRGIGRQKTIIRHQGMVVRSTTDHMYSWLNVEGVSFVGPGKGTGLTIEWGTRMRFTDVEFRGWTTAVDGRQFWDSDFDDCSFSNCGDSENPVVKLGMLDESKRITNSNNITFRNCQFEPNQGVSLFFGLHTTKCRLVACKFHGALPTPAEADHMQLRGAHANTITACSFANGGGTAISLKNASGNIITSNQIHKCKIGISLDDAVKNVITQNVFTSEEDAPNGRPIRAEQRDNTRNVIRDNAL